MFSAEVCNRPTRLLNLISPGLTLIIPRLVVQEVTRNLTTPVQVRYFYRLFHESDFAFVVDEPMPAPLVAKYVELGLRQKADAFIGAFVEWMQVEYLISDNRHFCAGCQRKDFGLFKPRPSLPSGRTSSRVSGVGSAVLVPKASNPRLLTGKRKRGKVWRQAWLDSHRAPKPLREVFAQLHTRPLDQHQQMGLGFPNPS